MSDSSQKSNTRHRRYHFLFWPVALIGLGADLWTKQAVHSWLNTLPGREYSVIDGLVSFVQRENTGAAFSIAQGQTMPLIAVSVVALIVVLWIFLSGRIEGLYHQVVLALFAAGTAGNLYDRMFNDGRVRDFIDVYWRGHHWPTFNVADSLLCIAVGLILINLSTSASSQKSAHQQK